MNYQCTSASSPLEWSTKTRYCEKVRLTLDLGRGEETWETPSNKQMTEWLIGQGGRAEQQNSVVKQTDDWASPIPFFYVNEGVKQLCDLWGSRGKQFDALFLRCCRGFDAKSRIQSKSKGKLTVRHWRKVVCSLLWIVLSNTSNCLDETQDVSKWLYVHGSTCVWAVIWIIYSEKLTKLLKKCTTAFSLVLRRVEDCRGEEAEWPLNDPCEDQQRSS